MKTQPLRRQKNCLNCGNYVPNRFCDKCGQENTVPHETFGHLVKHFVADIFHYDSQFLLTIKYLFTKPGFLSREYREGRRVRYVNPIKLYFFTSFIFFLSYFYFAGISHHSSGAATHATEDSIKGARLGTFDGLKKLEKKLEGGVRQNDPGAIRNLKILKMIAAATTVEEFDAAYRQLPDSLQLSPFIKLLVRTEAKALKHYSSNEEKERNFEAGYYHNFPKIMLLCLPFFALFLKLAYFRNKQWLYADHAIFTLHIHVFAFILMAVTFPLFDYIAIHAGNLRLFNGTLACIMVCYLIIALRKNYGQSIVKSTIKGVVLYTAYITFLWLTLIATGLLVSLYYIYS